MQCLVVLAVLVAVAAAQPRPNIPETFYSEGQVESHEHDGAYFGDAQWASDVKQQKSIETYDLRSGIRRLFVLTLQRFDLGEVFEIDSEDRNECRERVVNGTMPPFWGWVQQAQYVGKDIFRTLEVDLWDATFGGLTLRVGVAAPNYNVPVFFARRGNGIDFLYEFHTFRNETTIDPKYFDIPPQCQGKQRLTKPVVAMPPVNAPARPNIPATFESDTEIRFDRGGSLNSGEGHWNEDVTAGKAVEEAHVTDDKTRRDYYFLALARFDLGKFYEVNSDNRTGCDVRPLSGKIQSAWGWVANATFVGTRVDHRGQTVDIWNYVNGGLNLTLGVDSKNVNLPVGLLRQAPHFEEELFFTRFAGQTPPSQYFDVPRQCNQTLAAKKPAYKLVL